MKWFCFLFERASKYLGEKILCGLSLLFFILTVLPTNAITTKGNSGFIKFFLREKEQL